MSAGFAAMPLHERQYGEGFRSQEGGRKSPVDIVEASRADQSERSDCET
jgi:hypothetical protein